MTPGHASQSWRCISHAAHALITISMYFNLLAQKHDRVTCATKQIERDSKDTDAINSYPEKVQIKLVCNTLQK